MLMGDFQDNATGTCVPIRYRTDHVYGKLFNLRKLQTKAKDRHATMYLDELLYADDIRMSDQKQQLSHLVGKPTMWFPNRSDTNWAVQAQKMARSLKFRI